MLISADGRYVVSNLGWVDRSSLWTYDVSRDQDVLVPLGDAQYLSLFPCKDPSQFAVLQSHGGALVRLSIHSFEQPASALCSLELVAGKSTVKGDLAALANAPRYYTAYYDPGHDPDYCLISVDTLSGELAAERFDWYDRSYDKVYQSIVGVTELPSGKLIVSVQRDSSPILYDPRTRRALRKLRLANQAGNPTFRLALSRRELWADDYDTLLKLDLDSLRVKKSRRLQPGLSNTGRFIGRWAFNREESLCLVPRPYSGDVVAISMDTMKTVAAARLDGQPLEAVFLDGKRIVARDWKSGRLLKGSL